VVVAGCGAASAPQKRSLHASAEQRLLALVSRARVAATAHDGTAVHTVLGEFVSEVQALKTSGQLTGSAAESLDREARTTAAQAAEQLHRAKPATKPKESTPTSVAAPVTMTADTATTPSTPAAAATPSPTASGAGTGPATAGGTAQQQNGQGTDDSNSPWSGHGHGYGHRHDAAGSAWWTALRNWIASSGAGGGND
jgi:hypothetical protein